MKAPLQIMAFLCATCMSWAQPSGLTNRLANTTLRMPLVPTPTINYRIPPDNPFVGVSNFNGAALIYTNVRTEFYAVGLRNPWRWSFDPVTGLLWLADVGQNTREEVDIIVKGGNYGWAYREGTIAGPKAAPPGFTSIEPITDYGRTEGYSVTGGYVYRGSTMPELYGAYIFGDYGSGRIWQMRYDPTNGVTMQRTLLVTHTGNTISCFGVDPSNGDILFGDLTVNRIQRIVAISGGYAISNAFPGLTFSQPVAIVSAPGETNRLFIIEQAGRIAVITNLLNPTRTVFMDLTARVRYSGEQGMLGLAFHPGYQTNRYFYISYTHNTNGIQTADNTTRHDRLARFEISPTDANAGMTNSELILIQQYDEANNHNAGDIHFGADGYLYLSLGDEGGGNDQFNNSQRIDKDFFSGIIRIDVDNRPGSLIPHSHVSNMIGPQIVIPPPTLADTGVFSDVAALTPNPGIIPYDVNTPYWTDGAIKRRWFCVPDLASRIVFRGANTWTFPVGMVWVQHFDLEMTNGVPSSRRPIETRILVRDSTSTGHYGATYRWTSPTNATVVPDEGASQIFAIDDQGTPRFQNWRYPSRADCLTCHNLTAGRALGFNTPQLNRDFDYAAYAGVVDNQLRALTNAGYGAFSPAVPSLTTLPVMARLDDESFGVQHRARSYLMANCAHCHYPNGPGLGNFNARIYQALSTQALIDGSLRDNLGDPLNRVIAPGSIANSVAYTRMASTTDNFRMPPPLDHQDVDVQALQVFRDWINELPSYPTFAAWQVIHFGSTNDPNAAAAADPDGDGAKNQLEYFTGTDPNNPADAWGINIQRAGNAVSIVYTQKPNYGFEVQWNTNLTNTASWRALSTPENRPNFSGQTQVRTVPDNIEAVPFKAYRVRVYEP